MDTRNPAVRAHQLFIAALQCALPGAENEPHRDALMLAAQQWASTEKLQGQFLATAHLYDTVPATPAHPHAEPETVAHACADLGRFRRLSHHRATADLALTR